MSWIGGVGAYCVNSVIRLGRASLFLLSTLRGIKGILPRPALIAGLIAMPLLAAIFTAVGVLGGDLVGVALLGVDSGVYWSAMQQGVDVYDDVLNGMVKSVVFGFVVIWIAFFEGYYASLVVLGLDFILTSLIFGDV